MVSFFSACNSSISEPPEIVKEFSNAATVICGDDKFDCEISRNAQGLTSVKVLEPTELKGLTFLWNGEGHSVDYSGLSCKFSSNFLPENSFATAIMEVLNTIDNSEGIKQKSSGKDGTIYVGESKSGKFRLTTDSCTGDITEINIDNLKLSVKFDISE